MDRSLTWLPTNTMDQSAWLANDFNQSAMWHCAEVTQVDKLPCTGNYMMIGSESFLEFLNGDDTLEAGSFEHMKYKLWSQLANSDRSACHYAILEMQLDILKLPPFPCPMSGARGSRLAESQVTDYAPFFVLGNENFNGGVILSPDYVLLNGGLTPSLIAYGLQPNDFPTAAFSSPNIVLVTNYTTVSSDLTIVKVSPSIPFGPHVSAARISDCSGPSSGQVGENVAFYGMGYDTSNTFSNGVKVSCSQIVEQTSSCVNDVTIDSFINSRCFLNYACPFDWGGPIMSKGPDGYYVVALIDNFNSPCSCRFSFSCKGIQCLIPFFLRT